MLKKAIKSSPTLTYLWFSIFSKKRGGDALPRKTDNFYLDGYPRSGNTFMTGMVKYSRPEFKFANHLHTIAGMKIALANKLQAYILFRNPEDSVSSLCIMKDHRKQGNMLDPKFVAALLDEWIDYYSFVQKNYNSISLVDFKLIPDKTALIPYLHQHFLADVSPADIEQLILEYEQKITRKQEKKPIERSMTPNKQRDGLKEEVKQILRQLPNYKVAMAIFDNMVEQFNKQQTHLRST